MCYAVATSLSQVVKLASWRFSWALRMTGFAIDPHNLSATIVAARWISVSVGGVFRSNHTRKSRSAIFAITEPILRNAESSLTGSILVGNLCLVSIPLTRLLGTPDRPIRRSTASGGQVVMRRVGRIAGCSRSTSGLMSVRLPVIFVVFSVNSRFLGQLRCGSTLASILSLGRKPTSVSTNCPPRNTSRVGRPVTPYWPGVCGFVSTSSLTTLILP